MSKSKNSLSPNSARGIDTAKKVPLPPGRSLMDWIRNAPKRSPRRTSISEDELAQHNTEEDCWLAVRDIVYDVTAYVAYHPGGRDQIMRGAGIDATELFNEYHPWVNVENMLKTCIVGRLSMTKKFKMPLAPALHTLSVNGGIVSNSAVLEKPFFDWMQDDNFVYMFVTINQEMVLRKEYVTIIHSDDTNEIKVYVYLKNHCFYLGFKLSDQINSVKFDIENNKNIKISLEKKEKSAWKKLGIALSDNKSFTKVQALPKLKFPTYLYEKTQLTHDSFLFAFRHEKNSIMRVPIGRHVHILLPNNQSLIRPYTPVPKSVTSKNKNDGSQTTLLIKIYQDGMFTSKLSDVKIGDKILMSIPEGTFDLQKVQDAVSITLFAAGTGITPMLGIIHHCLIEQFLEIRRLRLIFFNKTENDMMLKEEFEKLTANFPNNFKVTHVLSAASSSWTGKTGRISESLVREIVPQIEVENNDLADDEKLLCACGPKPFTDLTVQILKKLSVSECCIYPFSG